ncbi:MAG: acetyl-CoA carboxylase biotin carboxylase subunit [Thermodesulfobacteriota bacterium]
MFQKVLIANRGEIALRAIRACKEMDIKTVAVYSTADANAIHVKLADESVCIGPPDARHSYLNIAAILSAVEITDAEAIYPGYGFLAESPNFAEVCEECGIKFIGPKPEALALMGDKIKAREIMRGVNIPLLPGSEKEVEKETEARKLAADIGYPVIVKAAAGGGGKGMKVVHSPVALTSALLMAQTEAAHTFGDHRVYLEKYLDKHRHIEIQILADNWGNMVHLGERDCSIQRRHQKLLEESPCPGVVDEALRQDMGQAALTAAKAVNYSNAGTVEFLVDAKRNFYFSEMNTRIQVEHGITEMTTGVDLVKSQIELAFGQNLTLDQDSIQLRGHAMECRIYAEDPETFAPCSGVITAYHAPGGLGVRVDSAAYERYCISPYYDPLVAKLIVHADDRLSAIKRMQRALEEYIIEGVSTLIPFHLKILKDESFLRGDFYTQLLDKYFTS